MIRIDNSTAVAVRPTIEAAGTPGWWTKGDPGVPTPATELDQDWHNDVQAILMAVLTAGGITPTKGPGGDNDLRDAINALITSVALSPGTLVGTLKRTGDGIVQLQPRVGTSVQCEINNVLLANSGAITFNMASDLEGSEAASTPYYFYLRNDGGVLDAQISATRPDRSGETKPGYKNGDATRRCVGSIPNNAAQHFTLCSWGAGGWCNFHDHTGDHQYSPGLTASTWTSEALNLPLCASAVRCLMQAGVAGEYVAWGASDAATNPTVAADLAHANSLEILLMLGDSGVGDQVGSTEFPIADMANPALKWTTFGDTVVKHVITVNGYQDIFAPR
jgi:hypothetical protein